VIRAGRKFSVTVAYAAANRAYAVPVQAHPGTTLEEAIRRSGLLSLCPEIDLAANAVGVFGKRRPLSYLLSPDDRVEIYRPLCMDPKEARRRRGARP